MCPSPGPSWETRLLALSLGDKEVPLGRKSKGKFRVMNDRGMTWPGEYFLLDDNKHVVTRQTCVLLEGFYESKAPWPFQKGF